MHEREQDANDPSNQLFFNFRDLHNFDLQIDKLLNRKVKSPKRSRTNPRSFLPDLFDTFTKQMS